MWYLFKKEVNSYFSTPFGFVFMGIFLLASGVVFTIYNLLGANGDMNGMFGILSNISIMTFPVLTMKLFADERKAGTDKLLFSSRISVLSVVVGKYFAAVFVFLVTLLVTVFYVFLLGSYGSPNYGAIFGSYVGFFLLGASLIAICLFAASLAENHVTAAIASFGLLFLLVLGGSLGKNIQIPVIKQILQWVAVTRQYEEFTRGIFRLGPLVYYICFSSVFVFLSAKMEEKQHFQ